LRKGVVASHAVKGNTFVNAVCVKLLFHGMAVLFDVADRTVSHLSASLPLILRVSLHRKFFQALLEFGLDVRIFAVVSPFGHVG
jgi:hypothetical protein